MKTEQRDDKRHKIILHLTAMSVRKSSVMPLALQAISKNKIKKINYFYLYTVVFKARSMWGGVFPIELESGSVGFCGGWKTGKLGENPSGGARTRTNNKRNPHITPDPGIEPGPRWWKVSALTTAPYSCSSPVKTKMHSVFIRLEM